MHQGFHLLALEDTSDGNCITEIPRAITACYQGHIYSHLLFRIIEGLRWQNFGNNFVPKAFLMFVSAFLRKLHLFLTVIENGGHVLP